MAVNSDDKNGWREKYLDALDAQDTLEKTFTEQQELLRRALVRISVAADGQDEALDHIMMQLREKLRGNAKAQEVNALLAQLEHVAIAFEGHREQAAQDIRQALGETIKPLQNFKLSRSVNKEISQYLSQLPQRSKKVRLYPALLQQLASIQQLALKEVEQPKISLLGKILGGKTDLPKSDGESHDDNLDIAIPTYTNALNEPPASINIAPTQDPISPEFSARITRVLNAFLTSLENEQAIKVKVEAVQLKVTKGLAPEALIPTLESVRDLVMEAYLSANQAFANYLNNVNHELAEIYSLFGGAVKSNADGRDAALELQNNMIREIENIETSTANATDINQLKNQVKSQLGNIRQAIDHFQQADSAQQNLAEQLAMLGAKIKTMEVEAEKNRTTLEKHRHKALHDPLTELPNREAYNERAAIEIQRWQRYGRPLTIAIFDIDHFKKINDSYGHQAGDRVLKVIGRSVAKRLREVDFFCRYGGEEFVAIMPETNSATAFEVLEKIRAAIAAAAFNYKEQPMAITLSMGVTEFKEQDTLESAFERADGALYLAKSSGRNCCRTA